MGRTAHIVMLFWGLMTACGGGEGSGRTTYIVSDNSAEKGIITGQLQVSNDAPASSIAGANITVQDHPEILAKSTASGSFVINNAPAGTLNVIVTSADTGLIGGAAFGVKVDQITVKPQKSTALGSLEMKKTGTLSGRITFFENPNNLDLAGSDVYVPGTSYLAKTDSDGRFSITGLPEGSYRLKAQHSGFSTTTLEAVSIISGETTDLGDLALSLSLGPEGSIQLQYDLQATIGGLTKNIRTSREVTVNLIYDSDTALMKVSADPNFLNTAWSPAKRSVNWTFTSDGEKTLYVMYSDLNGLESSPFSQTVIIDTEAPTINEVKIMEGWAQTATPAVYIDLVGHDTGSGIAEVMLSNQSNFSGAIWQSFSSRVNWSVTSGNGPKTVYVKVKDFAGRISTASTDGINKGDYTLVHNTTYTKNMTFYKEYSPYLVTDNVTFNADLEIRAGTHIHVESGKILNVKGQFQSLGTTTENILISRKNAALGDCNTTGSIMGFSIDLSQTLPGVSEKNLIQYTRFQLNEAITFNGGIIENSSFDSSLCSTNSKGYITKNGLDNLVIRNNTFTKWNVALDVTEGISNTQFLNNSGSITTGLSQRNQATGTVFSNNTIQWTGGGTLYQISNGTIQSTGNQFSGSVDTAFSMHVEGSVNLNNIDLVASTGSIFSISGTGNVVISGFTINNCQQVFYYYGTVTIQASQLTVSNCEYLAKTGETGGSNTQNLSITNSQIAVTKAFFYSAANVSPTLLVSNSQITCSTNTNFCDLYYKEPMDGNIDTLTLTNNTITCTVANRCRGFTFNNSYGTTRSMTLNLTVTGNNFGAGKILNNDLGNQIFIANSDNINTTTDTEIKIFKFAYNGNDNINLTLTVSQ